MAGRKKGTTAEQRFWENVAKEDGDQGCWIWTGSKASGKFDYGHFWYEGKLQQAHRASYQMFIGPIPDGIKVLHRCDRYSCVRPDHLFLGTIQDNVDDMIAKGRMVIVRSRASLADDQVVQLLRDRLSGLSGSALSQKYGIHESVVNRIVAGKTYTHISRDGFDQRELSRMRRTPGGGPIGEKSGRSKITEREVIEIRRGYAEGGVTQRELGRRYGLNQTTVGEIIRGEKWKHVGSVAALQALSGIVEAGRHERD